MSGENHVIQPEEKPIFMSPLADPVVNAIFDNVQAAGLAAGSMIRVVLEAEGAGRKIGKIISVTPQRSHTKPKQRGSRIDVEVLTDENEMAIVEIQINKDINIMQRNLFSASRVYTKTSKSGDNTDEMASKLPFIIIINILNYPLRSDNNEVLQPFKILYTKPPEEEAVPQFSGYNIHLTGIPDMKPDFNNGFYCWFYTLYTAHNENKTITEVLDMTPELQTYAKKDSGYQQFCDQYNLAADDPETIEEYYDWIETQMEHNGIYEGGREDGRIESDEKWQAVVADKDAEHAALIADKDAVIAELRAQLEKANQQ